MKKWLVLICAVMMLCYGAMAEEDGYEPGEFVVTSFSFGTPRKYQNYEYVVLKDGTAEIVQVYSEKGDLILPSELDGYRVSSIGQNCFLYGQEGWTVGPGASAKYNYLTSVVVPDSVTYISRFAFSDCNASSIYIPDSVVYIGEAAFHSADISEVRMPQTITTIPSHAFGSCSRLASYTIPDHITTIEEGAFGGSALTCIVIPDSVTTIGKYAFEGCRHLTNVVFNASVTSIKEGTFRSCESLTSIVIPNSVTSIESEAFAGCTSLTNVVIPESVTSIGDKVFLGCTSLTNVVIPESVTSIGDRIFLLCTSLTTLTVTPGSYAEQYAIDNNIPYVYAAEATPAPDAEAGESAPADAFWTCTCGSLNDYNFCPNCGAARPVVEPTCSNCGYDPEGETPNFCPACGTRF